MNLTENYLYIFIVVFISDDLRVFVITELVVI